MPATLVRHVMAPALLPGATGHAGAGAEGRAAVVSALAESLDTLRRSRPGGRADGDEAAAVLVVAPARRSRRTVDGRPDLGALGLDTSAGADVTTGACGEDKTDERPRLDVAASVAVTMLRLAGWDGPVEAVERGLPESSTDAPDLFRDLADSSLVVFALASADEQLPAGAHPGLAAGQAEVWRLAAQHVAR